ncbi:MAG: ABC transporter permease [Eubacterium sp.]
MGKYILKRIGQTVFVLFAISIIVFLLMNVLPGDPVALMLEKRADPATVEQVRHSLGLDKPLLVQYFDFLKGVFQGDLGTSYFTKEPVMETLTRSFFITLQLAASSFVFAVVIGVTCGMLAAIYRGKALDSTLMTCSIIGISAPSFWVAIILQIIFGLQLDLLPISGFASPIYFILPSIALGTRYAASIARITRTSMLDVINQDYIRTARAKGVKENVVMFKHAFKNALIPIVTLLGTQLGYMLGGSMLIEKIFTIPGIGNVLVTSLSNRDLPLLRGAMLYVAVAFVLVNLLVDISYAFIDPRIRVTGGKK